MQLVEAARFALQNAQEDLPAGVTIGRIMEFETLDLDLDYLESHLDIIN